MPPLLNSRQERFAQELASGKTLIEAHELAGYRPSRSGASQLKRKLNITARIAEILTERAVIHEQAGLEAVKSLRLTKEWVIEKLIQNVERALQVEEVVLRDGTRTGKFVYNGHVANRALELLGRERGMFIERHEVGGAGEFARMTDQELTNKILEDAKALGIEDKALESLRQITYQPTKTDEAAE